MVKTFGAHADKANNKLVQRVLKIAQTQDLVSVGENGEIRLWTN